MSKIEDGGPAFPTHDTLQVGDGVRHVKTGGMSLRDWFAGQALAGIAQSLDSQTIEHLAKGILAGRLVAEASYRLADAMLAARKTGGSE